MHRLAGRPDDWRTSGYGPSSARGPTPGPPGAADARPQHARLRHGQRVTRRRQPSGQRRRKLHHRPHSQPRAGDDRRRKACRRERSINFTMESADSKIYPGIAREPNTFGTADPADPAKLIVTTSHPAPYTRRVAVYVPKQYVPGTAAPFIVGADGPDRALFTALDNLIAAAPRARDDRHLHRQRQRRRPGQRARPGIRHHVGPVRGVRREGSAASGGEAMPT